MSAEEAEALKPIPDPKPIASGQVFIGLCTLRNGAFHMLWWRAQFGLALNATALVAVAYQLAGTPNLLTLVLLVVGSMLSMYLNGYWRELISSAKKTEEYWTEELVQLEEINGIDGGCRVFTRKQFPKPGLKPRVPKVLRNTRRACIVIWGVSFIWTLATLLSQLGVLPWQKLWEHLSLFLQC